MNPLPSTLGTRRSGRPTPGLSLRCRSGAGLPALALAVVASCPRCGRIIVGIGPHFEQHIKDAFDGVKAATS